MSASASGPSRPSGVRSRLNWRVERWRRVVAVPLFGLAVGLSVVGLDGSAGAQAASTATVEQGGKLYMFRCASCHGVDGDEIPRIGVLTGQFRRPYTNAELVTLIRTGIPGTPMAPLPISEAQAEQVVAYLRWAAGADEGSGDPASATGAPGAGSADRGRALYAGKGGCAVCHRVNGVGGHLGPDLSDVGRRLRPNDLAQSITDPDAQVRPDASIARVVDASGTEIVARLVDQDTDLIQLITQDGRPLALSRATVRQFNVQTTSGMPTYADLLTGQEIADLVTYLQTLNAADRRDVKGGDRTPAAPAMRP
jgi:cytochrome c oxidase cbb3-type subunit 3